MPRKKVNKKSEVAFRTDIGDMEVVDEAQEADAENGVDQGDEEERSSQSPPISPQIVSPISTPKLTPKKPPPKLIKSKSKTYVKEDFHTKHEHHLKAPFIEIIVLALSVYIVRQAPIPGKDVQKPPSSSFLSLYISDKLDGVDHIDQILIAAGLSVIFDTFVIWYHLTIPPHPKFVMVPTRRFSIFTHLISGIIEICSGVAAFVITDQTTQQACAVLMSLASITHALTAYYQTGVVFGAKGIMVPGYLYAITIHITYAIRLYLQPTSFVYMYVTFLTLHIYVWCRVFVFIFRAFSAFTGYHYTLAITLSGALLFPYAMGPVGNFGFFFICATYCALEAIFSDKKGTDLARKLFSEHERFALITSESVMRWKEGLATHASTHSDAGVDNDARMAREVFDHYDSDKSGKLGVNEIAKMVKWLGITTLTASRLIVSADVNNNGSIDFDEFYRFIWNAGTIKDRLAKLPQSQPPPTEKEQAKLVFDMLDVDNSGYIDLAELQMLLTQWGMPEGEAEAYLTRFDNKTRQITPDIFYKELQPVWSFAITQVFEA